jgi:two-component system, sensor histidine kinase and response regulator
MKILLAEDSRTSQQLAMMILEDEGHSVEVADDGLVAVEMFAKSSFDLILMDVHMPEMDGFEATTRIREREQSTNSRTLIIAMTADESPGDRDRCLASGMDGYISKPLDMSELTEALARAESNDS